MNIITNFVSKYFTTVRYQPKIKFVGKRHNIVTPKIETKSVQSQPTQSTQSVYIPPKDFNINNLLQFRPKLTQEEIDVINMGGPVLKDWNKIKLKTKKHI